MRFGWIGLVLLAGMISGGTSWGQVAQSENTWKLDEGVQSPAASLDQIAWLAGQYRGEGMGAKFEETWNPPYEGVMMGMFRLFDERNTFYELLTIVEHEGSLLLRLKHFDRELKGWEEKDKTVDFRLVEITDQEIRFEGLTFRRVDEQTVHTFVVVSQGEKAEEVQFVARRMAKLAD